MENKVGVLTPNSLKELYPTASTRREMETAVSPMLSGSLHLFSYEYHSEGDSSV